MGKQSASPEEVSGGGGEGSMPDGGGMEKIGAGVARTFEIGGYILHINGDQGGESFWITLAPNRHAVPIAISRWDGQQNWEHFAVEHVVRLYFIGVPVCQSN